jgi:ATP-dependent Clp protease protease subunit
MSLIPYIIEDTGRGERSMDIYSRLLKDRIVLIGQPIDDHLANVVIAQLLFLMTDDPKRDIQIFINSPGGYITAGLAIYDTIRFLGCDVNTYCMGQAASMGALLLAAGTKGKRKALPHSRIMIHQPSGGVIGTSADIKLQAAEILKLKVFLAEILSECTGQSVNQIFKDFDRDFFMSPTDAIKYGLIDEIVTTQVKK